MTTKKVIASENLPTRLHLSSFIAWYLLLDKFNAPGWVWGTCGTLAVLLLIGVFYNMWREEREDIFKK